MQRTSPQTAVPVVVDLEWIEACRRGEPQAIDRMFRQWSPLVERMIGRLLGPTPDLEDLVQTTFLEAIRNLPRFRGEASLSTWLTSIAVHVAHHHLRAGKLRRHSPLEFVPEARLASGAVEVTTRLDERRLGARLHELLDRLTPKKRIAFVLYVVEERPIAEVAALMGATQVTTRSRVFFARRELQALIAADPELRDLAREMLCSREGGSES